MGSVWQYRDAFGEECSPFFSSVGVAQNWVVVNDDYVREMVFNDVYSLVELEVL